jgi:hypothetical protein
MLPLRMKMSATLSPKKHGQYLLRRAKATFASDLPDCAETMLMAEVLWTSTQHRLP